MQRGFFEYTTIFRNQNIGSMSSYYPNFEIVVLCLIAAFILSSLFFRKGRVQRGKNIQYTIIFRNINCSHHANVSSHIRHRYFL